MRIQVATHLPLLLAAFLQFALWSCSGSDEKSCDELDVEQCTASSTCRTLQGMHFDLARTCNFETEELGCIDAATGCDDALTPAEVDVLRLIAGGNANKEIAVQLSVTEETVKGRVNNILAKLGANDRTHAVTIALKRGIIEL